MEQLALLTCEYVADVVGLRAPHRDSFRAAIAEAYASGELRIAGVVGDSARSGLFAFTSAAAAEAFAARDPYVTAGLVTSHRIEAWNVVTP